MLRLRDILFISTKRNLIFCLSYAFTNCFDSENENKKVKNVPSTSVVICQNSPCNDTASCYVLLLMFNKRYIKNTGDSHDEWISVSLCSLKKRRKTISLRKREQNWYWKQWANELLLSSNGRPCNAVATWNMQLHLELKKVFFYANYVIFKVEYHANLLKRWR